MDAQGFLPLSLIAGFRRVQSLTTDVSKICEVMPAISKMKEYINSSCMGKMPIFAFMTPVVEFLVV